MLYRDFIKSTKERLEDALNKEDIEYYKTVMKMIVANNKNPRLKKEALIIILNRTQREIEKLKVKL